ncbi:MAG TPA: exodeoxyribonuclease VII small subunit [Pirellulales bacterium]|jgi:exodeoxyribonuclease VII small subunit|nr:exodeoxyribonuclease VII small subunit [Pirellulales bacterium]
MTDTPNSSSPEQPLSFESALARIETIVHELEEGQTGLAESLNRYEEGVRLLRQCYGLLEKAERRIELLVGADASGNPVTEPFDDTASAEREQQGAPRTRRRSASSAKAAPVEPAEPPAGASGVDAPGGLF